jgi:hypothetical protein
VSTQPLSRLHFPPESDNRRCTPHSDNIRMTQEGPAPPERHDAVTPVAPADPTVAERPSVRRERLRLREEHAWRLSAPELRSGFAPTVVRDYDQAFEALRQHEQYIRHVQQAIAQFSQPPGGPTRPEQRFDPRYPAGEHSRFDGGPANGLPVRLCGGSLIVK